MSKPANMLSNVIPWDTVAAGYADTTMQLFRGYAEKALELANITPQCKVLDVACGPGTLTLLAAQHADKVAAIDFSSAMVAILNNTIDTHTIDNIAVEYGDAQQLPFKDASFDAAFSMFGLMFFPDRQRGYSEIHRSLKPGGKVIISSWAPVADSPAMQVMFGAIKAMKPELAEPQNDIESLENPEFFKRELLAAGFHKVEIHRITEHYPIESAEKFWHDMVKGSAPIVMMKNAMAKDEWQKKEAIALDYLHAKIPNAPTTLSADAWFGYGEK